MSRAAWRGPSERTWLDATWSARAALGSQGQITAYRHRGVWLIEVDGDFADVVQDVDLAIQFALAEIPKGVVCSLMHPPGEEGAAGLVEALARQVGTSGPGPAPPSWSSARTAPRLRPSPDTRTDGFSRSPRPFCRRGRGSAPTRPSTRRSCTSGAMPSRRAPRGISSPAPASPGTSASTMPPGRSSSASWSRTRYSTRVARSTCSWPSTPGACGSRSETATAHHP